MKRVCIDAGHGGSDPGALGPTGLQEQAMSLDVAKRLDTLLSPYCMTMLTRDLEVSFVGLSRRAEIANAWKADAFISIHFNSASSETAHGFEIFTSPGDTHADALASAIFTRHGQQFPGQKQRIDTTDGDVDKEASFTVLTKTEMPAVLVEHEFIHTPEGEGWIHCADNRQRMAKAVQLGVLDFFGIREDDKPSNDRPAIMTHEERITRIENHLGLS